MSCWVPIIDLRDGAGWFVADVFKIWAAGVGIDVNTSAGLLYALLFSMGIFVTMNLAWLLARPYPETDDSKKKGDGEELSIMVADSASSADEALHL